MNINTNRKNISFSKIDKPLEAFLTPPNDPLVGILMGNLPKDKIEIRGSIGDRTFSYNYSFKENKIKMEGAFDGLPFDASGTLAEEVNIDGHMGENTLFSNIKPANQGPFTSSRAGELSLTEKVDINPWNGIITINGSIGQDELRETIKVSSDGYKILDKGSLGEWNISREVVRKGKGFHIKGSMGDLNFEEEITAG